jgi:mono/diheme cytochrome c family protein
MRRVALGAAALVVSAGVNLPALADDARAKSPAMSRGWEFNEQGGADLFRNVCAACHQADAKGAVGAGSYPPLADDKNLVSTDFVLAALLGGLRDMPPVGGMMSDAQVADVVTYVRTHFGNAYPGALSAADVAAARRRASPPDSR